MSSPLSALPLCHTEPETWIGVLFVILECQPFKGLFRLTKTGKGFF
jgi:hypothetical protein